MAKYHARIRVTLKPTVNDPQGNTVAQALGTLGFDTVEDVRIGKFIEVKLIASSQTEAEEQIALMGEKLLANPVIELFDFEVYEV